MALVSKGSGGWRGDVTTHTDTFRLSLESVGEMGGLGAGGGAGVSPVIYDGFSESL